MDTKEVEFKKLEFGLLAAKASNIAKDVIIQELQNKLVETEKDRDNYRNKLLSGKELSKYIDWKFQAPEELSSYIEAMAAAYYLKTDISPNHVVLQVAISDDGKSTYYWLKRRNDIKETLVPVESFETLC